MMKKAPVNLFRKKLGASDIQNAKIESRKEPRNSFSFFDGLRKEQQEILEHKSSVYNFDFYHGCPLISGHKTKTV